MDEVMYIMRGILYLALMADALYLLYRFGTFAKDYIDYKRKKESKPRWDPYGDKMLSGVIPLLVILLLGSTNYLISELYPQLPGRGTWCLIAEVEYGGREYELPTMVRIDSTQSEAGDNDYYAVVERIYFSRYDYVETELYFEDGHWDDSQNFEDYEGNEYSISLTTNVIRTSFFEQSEKQFFNLETIFFIMIFVLSVINFVLTFKKFLKWQK